MTLKSYTPTVSKFRMLSFLHEHSPISVNLRLPQLIPSVSMLYLPGTCAKPSTNLKKEITITHEVSERSRLRLMIFLSSKNVFKMMSDLASSHPFQDQLTPLFRRPPHHQTSRFLLILPLNITCSIQRNKSDHMTICIWSSSLWLLGDSGSGHSWVDTLDTRTLCNDIREILIH